MSDSSDSSKPRPKTAAVPHYTVGEEIMNSVTHGVGCLLGIAGLVLLIVFAALRGGGPAHMAAAIVYGVSIILEYLASTLYHAIQPARAKRVFRIIDHSCIYLLIAGSYTPFCLITLANDGEQGKCHGVEQRNKFGQLKDNEPAHQQVDQAAYPMRLALA